jgi:hypothetical protein
MLKFQNLKAARVQKLLCRVLTNSCQGTEQVLGLQIHFQQAVTSWLGLVLEELVLWAPVRHMERWQFS